MPTDWARAKSYVKLWLAIKVKWNLTIDTKEQEAIRKILGYEADSVNWPEIAPEYRCGKDGKLILEKKKY